MRDAFVQTLLAMAKEDKRIQLITGDLGFGVLKPFWEALPDQFLNVGIAEQNMISMAAGMALSGKTAVVYSIGNFPTLRCLEQIRNDCAYHNANVKIVCVGGGFTYGGLGMSHHATEDLAVMRALPGVTVLAPGDAMEAEQLTKAMLSCHGTCYLRLERGGEGQIRKEPVPIPMGKAIPVRQGGEAAVFCVGGIYDTVRKACEILESKGVSPSVWTFPTVKPLDAETIRQCAEKHRLIVTCEEHNVTGGFGSAVAEVLAEHPGMARLLRVGVADTYASVAGDQDYLRRISGLDPEEIARKIMEALR